MIHVEARKKIIEARKKGMFVKDIAKAYSVSMSAVNALLRIERETGSIMPRTHLRGRKPALDSGQLKKMRTLITEKPDITLEEIREQLELPIKKSAISKIINEKLGFRYKKRRYMPVNVNALMLLKSARSGIPQTGAK